MPDTVNIVEYKCYMDDVFEPFKDPYCVACGFCNNFPSSFPARYKNRGPKRPNPDITAQCVSCFGDGQTWKECALTRDRTALGTNSCVDYDYTGCSMPVIGGAILTAGDVSGGTFPVSPSCFLSGATFFEIFTVKDCRDGYGECGPNENGGHYFRFRCLISLEYGCGYLYGNACLVELEIDLDGTFTHPFFSASTTTTTGTTTTTTPSP